MNGNTPVHIELDRLNLSELKDSLQETTFNENEFIETNNRIKWKDALPQIFASLLAFFPVLQAGVNMSYSAILIPQLTDSKSQIQITKSEASWIASLVAIGTPVGSLTAGFLMDRLGRQKLNLMLCIPFIISWALISTAKSIYPICIARVLAGFTSGLTTVVLVYVSEISHPSLRPMLLCLNSVYVSFGILLTSILGLFFQWNTMADIFVVVSVASIILVYCVPESPHWLMTFKPESYDTAKKSLKWIYRDKEVFDIHLKELKKIQPACDRINSQDKNHSFKIYAQPKVYKPLILLICLFIFQQLSGVYAVIFYAVNLFQEIGGQFGNGINEYEAMLLLGTIRFIMSILVSGISRSFGRRPLMIISGLGMFACTLSGGLFMFYKTTEDVVGDVSGGALPNNDIFLLVCVLGFVCFSAIGVLVIPWTLIGEILPTEVKGKLGGLIVAMAYVLMFGVVKIYPSAMEAVGVQSMFYIFATASFFGVLFSYFFLPETLGKSFLEIEKHFTK